MSQASPALLFPPFHIPTKVDLLYRGQTMLPLERRAVQVLRYLAEHNERVVTKDELLEAVWPDTFTTDGVLKRAVSQARRALGEGADENRFIETYHGQGYRFIAPVTVGTPGNKQEVETSVPVQAPAAPLVVNMWMKEQERATPTQAHRAFAALFSVSACSSPSLSNP